CRSRAAEQADEGAPFQTDAADSYRSTPNIVNLTVKRRYLTQREVERDEHRADLQVARRALPPNPLEHLAPMLLPVLRQIEQKAPVERSPCSPRRAARVSRDPRHEPAVDAAIDELGGGVWLSVRVHRLRLVLRRRGISDSGACPTSRLRDVRSGEGGRAVQSRT